MIQTIQDVKVGDSVSNAIKGDGIVIKTTPRTITIKFDKSTSKLTYRHKDAYFYPSDF